LSSFASSQLSQIFGWIREPWQSLTDLRFHGLQFGIASDATAFVAGVALTFYFLFAMVAHVRVRDTTANTVPAFVCLVLSALYLLTTIAA
jgi:hypothetical protein